MAESAFDLTNLKEKLKSLIKYGKKREILNLLKKILTNKDLSNEQFYDLIGVLLLENHKYFMNKFYKSFQKQFQKDFSPEKLCEIEQYILKKYSFFEGEEFLKSFKGRVIQKDNQVTGRVYLTNYRVIAHGKFGPTALSTMGAIGTGLAVGGPSQGSTFAGGFVAFNIGVQKQVQKKLQEVMGQYFQTEKPCFGYQYPIINAFKIIRKNKSVNYRVNLEYQKGNRTKTTNLKIKIIPKQESGEKSSDFNIRRNEILDLVLHKVNQFKH
ncbi:MAG: hypothetical protein ACFFAN_17840 [Promethearchaeota archaeon]